MCTNLDTGARAGPVPFLPHESISTASECLVSMGQNKITGNSRYKEVLAHPRKIRHNLKFVVSKIHVRTNFSIFK
jgi:hypothetical protein